MSQTRPTRSAPIRTALAVAVGLACALAGTTASANIYSFKDENGVTHFSNMPHLDRRYKLVYRIPTSGNMRPNAWSPSGPSSIEISRLIPIINDAARINGVDPRLIHAVIRAESGYNANAVSPKGAMGLMQLMPDTARRFGVEADKKVSLEKKLFDPKINVKTGTRYLRLLIDMFPGRLDLALASYNAGEGAVVKAGNQIPNFKETQAYVKTVMQLYAGLKPPAAVAEQRYPTRVRMEMLGGAARRGNMLAPIQTPIQPSNHPGAAQGGAAHETTP